MSNRIEILDVKNVHYKTKLITIIKANTNYTIEEIKAIVNRLYKGESVILESDMNVGLCNEFLFQLSDLGVAIGYLSWHEDNGGGGLQPEN